MEYWIEVNAHDQDNPNFGHVWAFDGTIARRISTTDAAGVNVVPLAGESQILHALKKRNDASDFHKLKLAPGEYHPYMARPTNEKRHRSPGWNPELTDELKHNRARRAGQLHALVGQLETICRVVQPEERPEHSNLDAYGHEIRNVLLVACTEVEAQWKSILSKNGISRKYQNTNDYVRLAEPMRLNEYCVSYSYFPWMPTIRPFAQWDAEKASDSLPWYSAYNKVKHNIETQFSQATLLHAFEAVTATFVLMCAQYGRDFALEGNEADRAFLKLVDWPNWHPSEVYVCPYGAELRKVNCVFLPRLVQKNRGTTE